MKFKIIPLFYKPSLVIAIDDEPHYLDNLKLFLSDEIHCKTFDNPKLAISYVNENSIVDNFESKYLTAYGDCQEESSAVSLSLKDIHKEIYNEERFNEISLIISDFVMPLMNGIEVFKQINNPRIQKLLLTGQADTDLAVNAFNNNIIQKFILKNTHGIDEALLREAKRMQIKFFENHSERVLTAFLSSDLSILRTPDFKKIFNTVLELYNVVEFYILDSYGSFLMLDEEANPVWFVVRKKQDIIEQADFVADYDVSPEIINNLKTCSRLPFFYSDDDYNIGPKEWLNYMHPAKKINDEFVYAIVEGSDLYKLEKIHSYHDFIYQ